MHIDERSRAATMIAASVLSVLLTGCGPLLVTRAVAHPNLVSARESTPTELSLADGILDEFEIPETGTVRTVQVSGWRGTLEGAFQNAFPTPGSEPLRLEILSAELSYGPLAMDSNGITRAVVAMIRFRARLVRPDGTEVAVSVGTVQAREAITSPATTEMTRSAGLAVEAMFERIAAEMMSPTSGAT